MSETETQQAEADPQDRVEFTIPDLLNSLSQNLHRLLEPNGMGFMVVITSKAPDENENFPLNYATTMAPDAAITLMRAMATEIEKAPRDALTNISAEDMAAALSSLGAEDPQQAPEGDTKSG